MISLNSSNIKVLLLQTNFQSLVFASDYNTKSKCNIHNNDSKIIQTDKLTVNPILRQNFLNNENYKKNNVRRLTLLQ